MIVEERIYTCYCGKAQPLVLTQQNKILIPAPFSPWANGPAYASAK
jgi:hypothetical protein